MMDDDVTVQTTDGWFWPQGRDGGRGQRHDAEDVGLEHPAPIIDVGVFHRQIVGVDTGIVHEHA